MRIQLLHNTLGSKIKNTGMAVLAMTSALACSSCLKNNQEDTFEKKSENNTVIEKSITFKESNGFSKKDLTKLFEVVGLSGGIIALLKKSAKDLKEGKL